MEFRYDKFTEEWAQMYKPMSHVPGPDSPNERFFITDSWMHVADVVNRLDVESSPYVLIESMQEGMVDGMLDRANYTWYFFVRADEMSSGHSAIEAKLDAKHVMVEFVNFLRMFVKGDEDRLQDFSFAEGSYMASMYDRICMGLPSGAENIDVDNFQYESLNEMFDGWFGIQISLSDMRPYNRCADPSMYINK